MHVCTSRHTQCSNMVVATAGMYRTLLWAAFDLLKNITHPNFFSLFSDHNSRRCSSFCEGGVANNRTPAWRSGRGYSDHRVMRRNTSWIQYEYHERNFYLSLRPQACWGWLHDNSRYTQGEFAPDVVYKPTCVMSCPPPEIDQIHQGLIRAPLTL